jgi:hypothetical protein
MAHCASRTASPAVRPDSLAASSALFEYAMEGGALFLRLGDRWANPTWKSQPVLSLTVEARPDGRVLMGVEVETTSGPDGYEVDPAEYDEADRAVMRQLLQLLGYQRTPVWTWKAPQ